MSFEEQVNQNLKNVIIKARNELLLSKKPETAIKLLESINNESLKNSGVSSSLYRWFYNVLGMSYIENQMYDEAFKALCLAGENYLAGFSRLLVGKPFEAEKIWNDLPDSGPVQWGKCLLKMIDDKVRKPPVPSIIQIRNHLEMDLSYLIQADRMDYAENLINCCDILAEVNPEAYKFIGKALMINGYNSIAAEFLIKSSRVIPNDPEIYFFLGQYSYNIGVVNESVGMFKECLRINSSYTPAQIMIDKIKNKIPISYD